jgi:lysophospholipase L1-like esterase
LPGRGIASGRHAVYRSGAAGRKTVLSSGVRAPIGRPDDKKEAPVPDYAPNPEQPQATGAPRRRRAIGAALSAVGVALLAAACAATGSGTAGPGPGAAGTPKAAATPAASAAHANGAHANGAHADEAPTSAALHGAYVALGDSYVAGLGIPGRAGAVAGCGQSLSSYPYLVARALRLKLTDMSCSSATIASLSDAEATGDGTNPAQLSALSPATTLVTLGIGGNDVDWGGVIARCTELDLLPALIPGRAGSDATPCRDHYARGGGNVLGQRIQAVGGQLAETLTGIRQRAPRARVYVIGYPDLLPATGAGCGGALGLTAGDIAFLNTEELRLNAALERAALAAGDRYVNTYAASEGHSACATPAGRWIEPLILSASAAPLHPNASGEQSMADLISQAVKAVA